MFGVVLLIAGFIYDDQPKRGPTPLSQRCSELGGEWLYKSADLLCLMPDGSKLSYSAAEDNFLPYSGSGGVVPVAQASSGDGVVEECLSTPDFDDYKTSDTFDGVARVDFSTNEDATRYRTAIAKDMAAGVNYAGRYVVSIWGCGNGCQGSAVVNGDTGKILSYGVTAPSYAFERQSKLLYVEGSGYFLIDNDELRPLCREST